MHLGDTLVVIDSVGFIIMLFPLLFRIPFALQRAALGTGLLLLIQSFAFILLSAPFGAATTFLTGAIWLYISYREAYRNAKYRRLQALAKVGQQSKVSR